MIDLWFAESPVALDTSVGYVVAQNMAIQKKKPFYFRCLKPEQTQTDIITTVPS